MSIAYGDYFGTPVSPSTTLDPANKTKFVGLDRFVGRGIKSDTVREIFKHFYDISEMLAEAADSLNTCSTGVCLLAMTIERYVFICYPMSADSWLSKQKHMILCVTSSTVIILGFSMNFVGGFLENEYFDKNTQIEPVIAFRVLDGLLFFALPACICGYLSIKIAWALKGMLSHQERNQQIYKALLFTWLAWILLWTPSKIISFIKLLTTPHSHLLILKFNNEWHNRKIKFWSNLSDSLSLLYSSVTPVIFIILIRSFQEPITRVFQAIREKCNCKK